MARKSRRTVHERLRESGPGDRPPTARELAESLRTLQDAARDLRPPAFQLWACLVDAEPESLARGVGAVGKALGMERTTLWRALRQLSDAGYVEVDQDKRFARAAVRVRIGMISQATNHVFKVGGAAFTVPAQLPPSADPERGLPRLTVIDGAKGIPESGGSAERLPRSITATRCRTATRLEPLGTSDEIALGDGTKTTAAAGEVEPPCSTSATPGGDRWVDGATPYSNSISRSSSGRERDDRSPLDSRRVAELQHGSPAVDLAELAAAGASRVDVAKLRRMASPAARMAAERSRTGAVKPAASGSQRGRLPAPAVVYGFTVIGEQREVLLGHLARGYRSRERVATVRALGNLAREQYTAWRRKRPGGAGFVPYRDYDRQWRRMGVACFMRGMRPVRVFDYWADPEHNFTRLNEPVESVPFVCGIPQIDAALSEAGSSRPAGAPAAPAKVDALHAFDPRKLHPDLRRTLEAAGHDVSGKSDGDLMTVQTLAKDYARGRTHVFAPAPLPDRARATMHLFGEEGGGAD